MSGLRARIERLRRAGGHGGAVIGWHHHCGQCGADFGTVRIWSRGGEDTGLSPAAFAAACPRARLVAVLALAGCPACGNLMPPDLPRGAVTWNGRDHLNPPGAPTGRGDGDGE